LSPDPFLVPSFQCLIVGNPECPGTEILTGSPLLQVPEQREEHFLHNVLSVLDWKTEADHVAEQSIPQLIEKADYLFRQRGSRRRASAFDRCGRREPQRGFWRRLGHG
jgi:hypothetical protein